MLFVSYKNYTTNTVKMKKYRFFYLCLHKQKTAELFTQPSLCLR